MIANVFVIVICFYFVKGYIVDNDIFIDKEFLSDNSTFKNNNENITEENATNVFNGVYTECILFLSYTCIQKKTLLYLQELNRLNEISIFGDHLKFGNS